MDARIIALSNMGDALKRISNSIKKALPDTRVKEQFAKSSGKIIKLTVNRFEVQVKIEPNEVLRGSVYPCMERDLVKNAESLFVQSVSINTLSIADLYGGKLAAAMDRQHPRDIYDVKILLENEGITDEIRKAFVIYLASNVRPIYESLDPKVRDIQKMFKDHFEEMAIVPASFDDLIATRIKYIEILNKELTNNERLFLVSVKEGQPKCELMGISGIEKLPALQWKVMNIQKMDKKKHHEMLEKLKRKLGV